MWGQINNFFSLRPKQLKHLDLIQDPSLSLQAEWLYFIRSSIFIFFSKLASNDWEKEIPYLRNLDLLAMQTMDLWTWWGPCSSHPPSVCPSLVPMITEKSASRLSLQSSKDSRRSRVLPNARLEHPDLQGVEGFHSKHSDQSKQLACVQLTS